MRPPNDWLGPLFLQEVKRLSRKPMNFYLRVAVVLLLLFTAYLFYPTDQNVPLQSLAQTNRNLFISLFGLQLVLVWMVVPTFAAAVVTEERESRTLELLLTTTVTNWDLVAGKLAARLNVLAVLVFAGLPVFCILLLFGGVSFEMLLVGYTGQLVNMYSVGGLTAGMACLFRTYRGTLFAAWTLLVGLTIVCFPLGVPSAIWGLENFDQLSLGVILLYFFSHLCVGTIGLWAALSAVRMTVSPEVSQAPVVQTQRVETRIAPASMSQSRTGVSTSNKMWDDRVFSPFQLSSNTIFFGLIYLSVVEGLLTGLVWNEPTDRSLGWVFWLQMVWVPVAFTTVVQVSGIITREREANTLLMLLTVPKAPTEILLRKVLIAISEKEIGFLWFMTTIVISLLLVLMFLTVDDWYWYFTPFFYIPGYSFAVIGIGVWASVNARSSYHSVLLSILGLLMLFVLPALTIAEFEPDIQRCSVLSLPILVCGFAVVLWWSALRRFERNPES